MIETQGAAALERGQDRAAAVGLPRPALAADRDHGRRGRARRQPTLDEAARARAGLGDRDRDRAAHAPGRQPPRPVADPVRRDRAAHRLVCTADELIGAAVGVGGRAAEALRPRGRRRPAARSRADAAQLERALANVIENALRYAGDGPVDDHAPSGSATSSRSGSPTGARDRRGRGERIFEPFYRGDGDGAARLRASGWRSRAASPRRTAASCGCSRSPGPGRDLHLPFPARRRPPAAVER